MASPRTVFVNIQHAPGRGKARSCAQIRARPCISCKVWPLMRRGTKESEKFKCWKLCAVGVLRVLLEEDEAHDHMHHDELGRTALVSFVVDVVEQLHEVGFV